MSLSQAQLVQQPVAIADRSLATETVRVLHVVNGEHYAGAERVQDLLAMRLPELGYEVTLACVKPSGRFETMRQSTNTLVNVPMRRRIDFQAGRRLADIVRDGGFQLIHAHTPRSAMVARAAAKATGVPMAYHVHSPVSRDSTNFLQNSVNALVERFCLRAASKLIAVSESLAGHLRRRGFNDHRIAVVPNGVPQPATLRDAAPPHGEWTLGTVALMRPRKGIEVLIDALGRLRAAGCPVRLRAVGTFETPGYEQQVKHYAAQRGVDDAIQWTGFTRDVPAELAQMDLFVLPSLFGEGLPMVVLEAMACGVPVVASDVEGIPEAVRHGQDGLLVRPNSVEALADAVQQFVRGRIDWSRLRNSAQARHAEKFSDHSMAAGVANVYHEVLAQGTATREE